MRETSSFPPDSAPNSEDFAQFSGLSTQKVILSDPDVRDALVKCSRPIAIAEDKDPKQLLIDEAVRRLRSVGNNISRKKVTIAIETLMRKELIVYDPQRRCFFPTLKTQQLLSNLYIVLCDKCGSSLVIEETGKSKPRICQRCGSEF